MADYPRLRLGHYLDKPETPVEISAPDIAHHTAILAQSGAGKSFFLGRLIEEILLKTQANVLVIDSNGDFRSAHDVDDRAWPTEDELRSKRWPAGKEHANYATPQEFREDWEQRVHLVLQREKPTAVTATPSAHWHRPSIVWSNIEFFRRVAMLGFEPREDPAEAYILCKVEEHCRSAKGGGVFRPLDEELGQFLGSIAPPQDWDAADWQMATMRVLNALGKAHSLDIWRSDADAPTAAHLAEDEGRQYDLQVLDLPAIEERDARLTLVSFVLEENWARCAARWEAAADDAKARDLREPLFIVVDEAHNFVPDAKGTPLEEQVAESIHRIAAEGRKYGLFLILATQRPAKVRTGLLAECENVCLLRLQSPVDHETATKTWGIPKEYVARTAHFGKGDGLLSGRWVPSATFFHAAYRRTKEGGASLNPELWAQPREPHAAEEESNG